MAKAKKKQTRKRTNTQNPTVIDAGIPCPRCGARYEHKITNTYANGNRRRICSKCDMPFVTLRKDESK